MFSVTFISFAAIFPAVVFASSCGQTYTVKAGDYCDLISSQQQVSTFQLAAINTPAINSECDNLGIGQTICLATTADEDCNEVYSVEASDSCQSILQAKNINSTMLWGNNPQIDSDCGNIYPGEVLCVANKLSVPPIPESGIPKAHPGTAPATTSAAPSSTPTPTPTPASNAGSDPKGPKDDGNDGDDDNLPFCDEL